jgi:hypothetical protein
VVIKTRNQRGRGNELVRGNRFTLRFLFGLGLACRSLFLRSRGCGYLCGSGLLALLAVIFLLFFHSRFTTATFSTFREKLLSIFEHFEIYLLLFNIAVQYLWFGKQFQTIEL